jgi:peptidoglycan/LPS O-acetylase OafA/YrhL
VTVLCAAIFGYSELSNWELWSNMGLVMNLTQSRLAIAPLWSLPYEIDMYVVLPFLFLFAVRFRSAWAVFSFIPVCGVLALLQPHWSPRLDLIHYVGCFLPGIMAYQLSSRPRYRWPARFWPVLLVFLAVLFVGLGLLRPQPIFVLRWSVCLLLGLAAPQFQAIPDGLIREGAGIIAKYSYGIYLLHTFALHIAFVSLSTYPVPLRAIAFLVMMVAFPWFAFRLIEKPGIDLGKRLLAGSAPAALRSKALARPL